MIGGGLAVAYWHGHGNSLVMDLDEQQPHGAGRAIDNGSPRPHASSQRFARRIIAAALALLAIYILRDFLPALAWAGVFAIATWPLYTRFRSRCPEGAREVLAPLVATLIIGIVFIAPFIITVIQIGNEARILAAWLVKAQQTGFPVPDWVVRLPGFGAQAAAWWQAHLGNPNAVKELLGRANRSVIGDWPRELGLRLLHGLTIFAFTLLTLFFIYRNGAALGERLLLLGDRLLGHESERLARAMISAVHGTVNGLVLVGLGEGVLVGFGYAATGVPNPALFGALTGILAMIPFGAPAVISIASLMLLAEGGTTAAIGLLAFGMVLVFIADHFIRPVLIGGVVRLPFLWVLLGILGGLESFGLLGLFIGPAVMAALTCLWRDWTSPAPPFPDAGEKTAG